FGTISVSVYQVDANGDPIPATRQILLQGLHGADGTALDPSTGDVLFTPFDDHGPTFDHVFVMQGFGGGAKAEPGLPGWTVHLDPADGPHGRLDLPLPGRGDRPGRRLAHLQPRGRPDRDGRAPDPRHARLATPGRRRRSPPGHPPGAGPPRRGRTAIVHAERT